MYITRNSVILSLILGLVLIAAPYISPIVPITEVSSADQGAPAHSVRLKTPAFLAGGVSENQNNDSDLSGSFPDLSAAGVLVADLSSEKILYEKNSSLQMPIASLTKLMTATLFNEIIDLSQNYQMSAGAKNTIPVLSPIPAGVSLSGEDIMKLMLIESANDAAFLAAEKAGILMNFQKHFPLSFDLAVESFVNAMNEKAGALGMVDTNFTNPIGFDDPMHYSTAKDLLHLIRYVLDKGRNIWHYSRIQEEAVRFENSKDHKVKSIIVKNSNPLLAKYPQIIGSKTGTTDEAGAALVFLYNIKNQKTIAVIILKASDRYGDAEKIIQWLDTSVN